jgi:hypothetical protein
MGRRRRDDDDGDEDWMREDTNPCPCRMGRFCLMQCAGCSCVFVGLLMIALGTLMPTIINTIIDRSVERSVVLLSSTDDQEHFDEWLSPSTDDAFAYESYYFFNLSGAAATAAAAAAAGRQPTQHGAGAAEAARTGWEALKAGGRPSVLSEVGPYTVRRTRHRTLERFNDAEGEVLYEEWHYADWQPAPRSAEGAAVTDEVETLSVPFQMMLRSLDGGGRHPERVLRAVFALDALRRVVEGLLAAHGAAAVWTVSRQPDGGPQFDFCTQQDCGAHGTCDRAGMCECKDGYVGTECRDPPDPCRGVDCGEHGTCIRQPVAPYQTGAHRGTCECFGRYTGPRCATPPAADCADGDYSQPSCRRCCLLTCFPVQIGGSPTVLTRQVGIGPY